MRCASMALSKVQGMAGNTLIVALFQSVISDAVEMSDNLVPVILSRRLVIIQRF